MTPRQVRKFCTLKPEAMSISRPPWKIGLSARPRQGPAGGAHDRGDLGVRPSFKFQVNLSRVGKGSICPIQLRVSPSPSKIPYGGFSPVRLQTTVTATFDDAGLKCRPHTPSAVLYAVTVPLPGRRDPQRATVLESCDSIGHDSQPPHVRPEALGSPAGYVVLPGHRLLWPHPSLWIRTATYAFRHERCTRGRLRAAIQRFPNLLRGLYSVPPPLPRWPRRVQMTVASSSVSAFTSELRVRRPHWSFRGCRVHSELNSALILRPASWLALLSKDVYIRAFAGRVTPSQTSNMTTWVNSQFPRPDFHRQVQRHYGLRNSV